MKKKKKIIIAGVIIAYVGITAVLVLQFVKGQKEPEIETYAFDTLNLADKEAEDTENTKKETAAEAGETEPQEASQEASQESSKEGWQKESSGTEGSVVQKSEKVENTGTVARQTQQQTSLLENETASVLTGGNTSQKEDITVSVQTGKKETQEEQVTTQQQTAGNSAGQTADSMNLVYEYGDGICTIAAGSSASGNIVIPDTVTKNGKTYKIVEISKKAFMGCESLTSVKIGAYVDTIASQAFQNCKSLMSVEFPQGLKTISYWAFNNCTNLKSVTVPGGANVDSEAFINCPDINITVK